jgi:hypothetical protein
VSLDTPLGEFDPRAPIVDGKTFMLVAELAVRQAVRLQYYVSLVVIQADIEDPGPSVDQDALKHLLAGIVRDQVRGTDLVGVTPESPHLQLLLPSTHLHDLPSVIDRIATAVNRQAFEAAGRIGRVTLSIGGASFPTTARARPELFRQAESLSAEARREPGTVGHRYRLAQRSS